MRRTRLTLNTVQLDVRPVPQPQSAHIVLLTARQQRLFSRSSLPIIPSSPPHITFRCFGWEDRDKLHEGKAKGREVPLTRWKSSETMLPQIKLQGKPLAVVKSSPQNEVKRPVGRNRCSL